MQQQRHISRRPHQNRKVASYFDRRRNKHDIPHSLDNVLVILGDVIHDQHAKVAPECVLSLFRRILVWKLTRLRLLHPRDINSEYNRIVTIYYNDDQDTPQGVFTNLRAENVRVYAEHNRILLVINEERGWGMNLAWVSTETAMRICSQQYWLVFQRVINDTIFDLKKQIYKIDGIYYAPIYHDELPPPKPQVASAVEARSPLSKEERNDESSSSSSEEEEEGACNDNSDHEEERNNCIEPEAYDESVHGCIRITARDVDDDVSMEDVAPLSLQFAY